MCCLHSVVINVRLPHLVGSRSMKYPQELPRYGSQSYFVMVLEVMVLEATWFSRLPRDIRPNEPLTKPRDSATFFFCNLPYLF